MTKEKTLKIEIPKKIKIAPAVTTLNATTRTATFTISNPRTDTVNVILSVSARGVGRATVGASGSRAAPTARLLVDDAVVDSVVEDSALVGWVTSVPPEVKLAPGEKKTVTVTVNIPGDVKPGVYAAWILASMSSIPSKSARASGSHMSVEVVDRADGVPLKGSVGTKLMYRVEKP